MERLVSGIYVAWGYAMSSSIRFTGIIGVTTLILCGCASSARQECGCDYGGEKLVSVYSIIKQVGDIMNAKVLFMSSEEAAARSCQVRIHGCHRMLNIEQLSAFLSLVNWHVDYLVNENVYRVTRSDVMSPDVRMIQEGSAPIVVIRHFDRLVHDQVFRVLDQCFNIYQSDRNWGFVRVLGDCAMMVADDDSLDFVVKLMEIALSVTNDGVMVAAYSFNPALHDKLIGRLSFLRSTASECLDCTTLQEVNKLPVALWFESCGTLILCSPNYRCFCTSSAAIEELLLN